MVRFALIFIILSILPTISFSQLIITDKILEELRVQEVSYIEDAEGIYNYTTIRNLDDEDWTSSSPNTVVNLESKAYWIKFTVINSTEDLREIIFDFKNWSLVDLYGEAARGEDIRGITGHLRPWVERTFPYANYNLVDAYIRPLDTLDFIAKLDPEFNGMIRPSDLSFKIAEKSPILKKKNNSNHISHLFIGIYLIMLVYNLFIWISTKDKSYRFYILSLLLYLVALFDISGKFLSIFPNIEKIPYLMFYWHSVQPHLITIAVLLFINDFFRLNDRYPLWSKIIKADIIAVILMFIIIQINFDIGVGLIVLNTLPFLIIVFVVSIKSFMDNYPGSIYVIIGHIFWFMGGIGNMLSQVHPGVRESEFFSNHSIFLGSGIEMVMFSLALANTINYLKKENEEKQKKIIQQLQENAELQDKVNRELEAKVMDRTQEIFDQKEEINDQKKNLESEKERSDGLLLNILPKEIAEELKQTGKANPRVYENVSILLVDITKFSNMVRNTKANDLVEDLDTIFSAFDDIVGKYNLEKIKTIGDAYLCVGGLPIVNETHALDTVKAAQEMIAFMSDWRKKKKTNNDEELNLRVGIHTGAVVAGVVGKIKFQFDIWGDAVNLAARMEAGSSAGRINISNATYQLVKDHYECEHRGKFSVKNMGEVDMYFVNGVKN